MSTQNRKKEEGMVLIVVAVLLVALIGFVALAVDVGLLYAARTSAQEVADAAALAGALDLATRETTVAACRASAAPYDWAGSLVPAFEAMYAGR